MTRLLTLAIVGSLSGCVLDAEPPIEQADQTAIPDDPVRFGVSDGPASNPCDAPIARDELEIPVECAPWQDYFGAIDPRDPYETPLPEQFASPYEGL